MPPRIVYLTNDSLHGQEIMVALRERGISPDAVVLLGKPLPPLRGRPDTLRALAQWPGGAARAAIRHLRLRRRRAAYRRVSPVVAIRAGVNGRSTRRILARLQPDLIVLGGSAQLSPETIAVASMGVLNAHNTLLPWIRGNGGVGNSLEHGVALGATVHLVDGLLDTGPTLQRRLLPDPGADSLSALHVRVGKLAASMLAEIVQEVARTGSLPPAQPQRERHPLLRWPSAEQLSAQDRLARSGTARALFQTWASQCEPGQGFQLRSDAVKPVGKADCRPRQLEPQHGAPRPP